MDYKALDALKESMKLVQIPYELTQSFTSEEKFGIISQIRRASVSIPSNIAEGQSRNSNKECKRFVEKALGSLLELESQLIISSRLNYVNKNQGVFQLIENLKKIIHGLIRFLKKTINY